MLGKSFWDWQFGYTNIFLIIYNIVEKECVYMEMMNEERKLYKLFQYPEE